MVGDEQVDRLLRALSRLCGWIYTLSWSLSFYPQPWLNWRRRSTRGTTVDFPLLNVVGFIAYTISTACFLYSPVIRDQYRQRHHGLEPTVRFNDLVFGAHAVILVTATYSQFFHSLWGFEASKLQRASRPVLGIAYGSAVGVLATFALVWLNPGSGQEPGWDWAWIDVIYSFGYVKLIVTFVKYIPQAWLNYRQQSTKGWSIWQILFDVTGGILSLLQLIIDSSFQNDWSGITGNPLKFGLANVSVLFDVIFITQHYILYRDRAADPSKSTDATEEEPLVQNR